MLLKNIHKPLEDTEADSDAETIKKHEEIQDPDNVIGLHDASSEAYKKFVSRLDPTDPHDKKIIDKISAGN